MTTPTTPTIHPLSSAVKLPTGQGGKVYTDRNNAEREARSLSSLTGRSYRAQSIVMPDGTRGYWVSNPRYQS